MPAAPVPGDTTRVDTDAACLNCGYNLRTLPVTGDCPECGFSVKSTLRQDRLDARDVPWLTRLRQWGAAPLIAGTILTPLTLYLGLAVATIGLWGLLGHPPERDEASRDAKLRWGARVLLASGMLVLLATVAAAVYQFIDVAFGGRWIGVDVGLIAGHALYIMGLLLAAASLRGLAQRIPDDVLVHACDRLRRHWFVGVGLILAVAVGVQGVDWLLGAGSTSSVYAVRGSSHDLTMGMIAGGLATLVLIYLWIVTLRFAIRWWQRLDRARAIAAEQVNK